MGGDEKINSDNERLSLGKRIAKLRRGRDWTQDDLALRTGLSKRTVGTYEREGPVISKLNLLDAVFGGELLKGTALESRPLDGTASPEPASTNGTVVLDQVRSFDDVVREFAEEDDRIRGISLEHAADQDCVTAGVEPLGLLFDEVFGQLRLLKRRVEVLEKGLANEDRTSR